MEQTVMEQNDAQQRQINFIAVTGFAMSLLSIPLFFLCIGQVLSLLLSILGRADAKKCGNRGVGYATAGIIISILVIVGTLITAIVVIWHFRSVMENYGFSQFTEHGLWGNLFNAMSGTQASADNAIDWKYLLSEDSVFGQLLQFAVRVFLQRLLL